MFFGVMVGIPGFGYGGGGSALVAGSVATGCSMASEYGGGESCLVFLIGAAVLEWTGRSEDGRGGEGSLLTWVFEALDLQIFLRQ